MLGRRRMQVTANLFQRKAMTGRQRQHNRIFGGRRLQFEIEGAAEALAQRQPPRTIDAAAVRRMDDQLGTAAGIEDALHDQTLLGGHRAQCRASVCQIIHQLPRRFGRHLQLALQPVARGLVRRGVQPRGNLATQARHRRRQLIAATRRFAQPERNVRRRALGIFHAHAPGLHAQDAVARIAELEHIAGEAFNGEILVHRADLFGLRFQHHAVVAGFGNGAAGSERRHARTAPCMQAPVHGIAMQIPGARTEAGAEAIAQHAHHAVEGGTAQPGERPRAPHQREQRIFVPVFACGFGNDLLRQHIHRRRHNAQGIQFAAADAVQQRGAFDQFVAGLRKQARLGRAADLVSGTPGALQEGGNRARRTELADQIDIADIQPQFQRCGRHQHGEIAGLEPLLGQQARLARQAAVMRRHALLAEQIAQMPRRAFGHAPCVDEHQRGAMLLRQCSHIGIHLQPLVVGHHHAQRRGRQRQGQITLAGVADIDDLARRRHAVCVDTDQELRHRFDGLLGGRQPHPRDRLRDQPLQALQRQAQVAAALVRRHRVDFIDDHGAHMLQRRAPGCRPQQYVQRLRGGHQNMRRRATRLRALALRGIAGTHRGTNRHIRQAAGDQRRTDALQGRVQIEVDVVGQGLQRRDVDHTGFVGQRTAVGQPVANQCIDGGEEGRQRLARAGRRGHQRVASGLDRRPRGDLRRCRRSEGLREPRSDHRMEVLQDRMHWQCPTPLLIMTARRADITRREP